MDEQALIDTLLASHQPSAGREFDAKVMLECASSKTAVLLELHHGDIRCRLAAPEDEADFTLYFNSCEQAAALLTGQADPVAAFMAHQFRADGYLIWVFSVLAMFRRSS